jgi:hypothetical protein
MHLAIIGSVQNKNEGHFDSWSSYTTPSKKKNIERNLCKPSNSSKGCERNAFAVRRGILG